MIAFAMKMRGYSFNARRSEPSPNRTNLRRILVLIRSAQRGATMDSNALRFAPIRMCE